MALVIGKPMDSDPSASSPVGAHLVSEGIDGNDHCVGHAGRLCHL